MAKYRKASFLLFLLLIVSCSNLVFEANDNPIRKLQLSVRMAEDQQLLFMARVLMGEDSPMLQIEDLVPLDSIYPLEITDSIGVYTGEGGEYIGYDYSSCVSSETCEALFTVTYPGNSMIKERELRIFLDRGIAGEVTDDTIERIVDDQRLRDGSTRRVVVDTGRDVRLHVDWIFPPLSPYVEKTFEYYFTSVTIDESGKLYAGEITAARGELVLEDGERVYRYFSVTGEVMGIFDSYSVAVTEGGALFDYGDYEYRFPGAGSVLSGKKLDNGVYVEIVPVGESPVLKRIFAYTVTDSVTWEDRVIYNDSTMDRITGRLNGNEMSIEYGGYEGILNYNESFEQIRVAGTLYGRDGVVDLDIGADLGVWWSINYWWDDYNTRGVAPDEEGEIYYRLFHTGGGSVTVFKEDGSRASTTYSIDLWRESIN